MSNLRWYFEFAAGIVGIIALYLLGAWLVVTAGMNLYEEWSGNNLAIAVFAVLAGFVCYKLAGLAEDRLIKVLYQDDELEKK